MQPTPNGIGAFIVFFHFDPFHFAVFRERVGCSLAFGRNYKSSP
jgi:hypothetical protein